MASLLCPLCGSGTTQGPLSTHQDAGTAYTLYECETCQGQFWIPFMNPGATWYERDERYAARNADPILTPNEKHRATVAFFKRHEGSVLDAGCGVGNFLAYAVAHGWKGWGIDFDADAIAAAKETFGLTNLEVADLSEFHALHPELRFDLITYFDVFEHLDNHQEFIAQVKEMLAPHGSVALSMPYRRGWRWLMQADLPPRHLTRWDEPSIRAFYERNGFAVRRVIKFPASFSFLVIKLRFRYGSWASIGLVRKVQATQQAGKTPSTPGSRPLKVRLFHALARAKDILLFGIPAGILWFFLLFTDARYTDFLCIATLRHHAHD